MNTNSIQNKSAHMMKSDGTFICLIILSLMKILEATKIS